MSRGVLWATILLLPGCAREEAAPTHRPAQVCERFLPRHGDVVLRVSSAQALEAVDAVWARFVVRVTGVPPKLVDPNRSLGFAWSRNTSVKIAPVLDVNAARRAVLGHGFTKHGYAALGQGVVPTFHDEPVDLPEGLVSIWIRTGHMVPVLRQLGLRRGGPVGAALDKLPWTTAVLDRCGDRLQLDVDIPGGWGPQRPPTDLTHHLPRDFTIAGWSGGTDSPLQSLNDARASAALAALGTLVRPGWAFGLEYSKQHGLTLALVGRARADADIQAGLRQIEVRAKTLGTPVEHRRDGLLLGVPNSANEKSLVFRGDLDQLGVYDRLNTLGAFAEVDGGILYVDSFRASGETVRRALTRRGGAEFLRIVRPGTATFEGSWQRRQAGRPPGRDVVWRRVAAKAASRVSRNFHRDGWLLGKPVKDARITAATAASILVEAPDTRADRQSAFAIVIEEKVITAGSPESRLTFDVPGARLFEALASPPLERPLRAAGTGPGLTVRGARKKMRALMGRNGILVRLMHRDGIIALTVNGAPDLAEQLLVPHATPPPRLRRALAEAGPACDIVLAIDTGALSRQVHAIARIFLRSGLGNLPMPHFARPRAGGNAILFAGPTGSGYRLGARVPLPFLQSFIHDMRRDDAIRDMGLSAPPTKPEGLDPWGRAYVQKKLTDGDDPEYRVRSLGPDGKFGTDDDIAVPKLPPPLGEVRDDEGARYVNAMNRVFEAQDAEGLWNLMSRERQREELVHIMSLGPRALHMTSRSIAKRVWLLRRRQEEASAAVRAPMTFVSQKTRGRNVVVTARSKDGERLTIVLVREGNALRLPSRYR